jgi:hypothetical protein
MIEEEREESRECLKNHGFWDIKEAYLQTTFYSKGPYK